MFDVFTGQKCQTSFDCDWEDAIKQCERLLYVPNWFTGELLELKHEGTFHVSNFSQER